MNANEAANARASYNYVPARLRLALPNVPADLVWGNIQMSRECPTSEVWSDPNFRKNYASRELDEYHRRLLNSNSDSEKLRGLASAVFWGFASGTTGRHTPERALARAGALAYGRRRAPAQAQDEVLGHLRSMGKCLVDRHPGNALGEAMKIKFLGFPFASKLVMFFDPSQAAVYDSVIAERLGNSQDPQLQGMAVSVSGAASKVDQRRAYVQWCAYCKEKAAEYNKNRCKWTDWDGVSSIWRAVDVERAFFALGRI